MIECEVDGCYEDADVHIPEYASCLCTDHLLKSLEQECMLHVQSIKCVEGIG